MDTLIEILGGPKAIWILAGGYFGMVIAERVFYVLRRPGRYNNADAFQRLTPRVNFIA